MAKPITTDQLAKARGAVVLAEGGEIVGELDDVYSDEATDHPLWLGVRGPHGARTLVPADGAHLAEDGFHVPFPIQRIATAPTVGPEDVTNDEIQAFYGHYGVEAAPPPPERQPGETAAAVTRHEEELVVGKRPVSAGRVRLRKWVETEPVAVDVHLQRETAHVRREPIEQPVEDIEVGEQEIELELAAEEPIVEKQTVAKERLVVEKDVTTDRKTVEGELRKERIELVDDDEPGA